MGTFFIINYSLLRNISVLRPLSSYTLTKSKKNAGVHIFSQNLENFPTRLQKIWQSFDVLAIFFCRTAKQISRYLSLFTLFLPYLHFSSLFAFSFPFPLI